VLGGVTDFSAAVFCSQNCTLHFSGSSVVKLYGTVTNSTFSLTDQAAVSLLHDGIFSGSINTTDGTTLQVATGSTLLLSGNNEVSGTLETSTGSTINVTSGSVVLNKTLQIQSDLTLANAVLSFPDASLTYQQTSGSLFLQNGTIQASNVTVENGTVLAGTAGIINGNLFIDGTSNIPQLNVTGSLIFSSGSSLSLVLNRTRQNFYTAGGDVLHAGQLTTSTSSPSAAVANYTIINFAGVGSGSFSVHAPSNLAAEAVYNTHSTVLIVTSPTTTTSGAIATASTHSASTTTASSTTSTSSAVFPSAFLVLSLMLVVVTRML